MSSAWTTDLIVTYFGRLIIMIRKKNCQNTDPCGTPISAKFLL